MLQLISENWFYFLYGSIIISFWNGLLGDSDKMKKYHEGFKKHPISSFFFSVICFLFGSICSPLFILLFFYKDCSYESLIKVKHLKYLLLFSPVLSLLLLWIME